MDNPNYNPGSVTKLTEWAKEPTVVALQKDFEIARNFQAKHIADIVRWNKIKDIKDLPNRNNVNRSKTQTKLVKTHLDWRYPSLSEPFLNTQEMFKIEPRGPEDDMASAQNEAVLNWQWDTVIDRVGTIDHFIRSVVDDGTAILRVGWQREKEDAVERKPVFAYERIVNEEHVAAITQQLQELAQLRDTNVAEFNKQGEEVREMLRVFEERGEIFQATVTEYQNRKYKKVVTNKPTIEVMDPANVYFDPACEGKYKNSRFVICSYETTRSNLKKDSRFKNLGAVDWTANGTFGSDTYHTSSSSNTEDIDDVNRKKIVVYEYWGFFDKNGNGLVEPIVASWIGNTMVRLEDNPFPDKSFPFVLATYQPVKRSLYGIADAEILESPQKVLGALERGIINVFGRSANAQTGLPKGFLDEDEKANYFSGKTYEFNPNAGEGKNSIIEHTFPAIPPVILGYMDMVKKDAQSQSGINSFSDGVSGSSLGDVAAGVNAAVNSTAIRENSILRRLADAVATAGKLICVMNQLYMGDEETVRVTNRKFVKVRREDLKGDFDLKVDISTNEADANKVQQILHVLQTNGPNLDNELQKEMYAEVFDLQKMPVFAERIRTMQPSKADQERAELEMEKIRLETEKLRSDIRYNDSRSGKTTAEGKKVDFERLAEISGLAHAQDKEQTGQQGRANLDHEILKALVQPLKEGERQGNIEAAMDYRDLVTDQSTEEVDGVRLGMQAATEQETRELLRQIILGKLQDEAQEAEVIEG